MHLKVRNRADCYLRLLLQLVALLPKLRQQHERCPATR
jgi:hypothetical protein